MFGELSFFDIGLIVFSIVGFLGLVQTLYAIIRPCIPVNRIKATESTFGYAYDLLLCANGEGLIPPPAYRDLEARFRTVRTEIDDAQSCILRLDSRWRHFLSIFGDVASTLGTIEATLKGLTLDIAYNVQVARAEVEKSRHWSLDMPHSFPKSSTDHAVLLL